MPKIIRNAIRCKKCGDIIESETVHDFKFCSCGSCAVDGGHDYLRRCGNREDWEELSKAEKVEDNDAFHALASLQHKHIPQFGRNSY